MNLDCASVIDAVWESVRNGTPLSEEILEHIRSCNSCADALAEAHAGLAALKPIQPCPPAPDCRSAVWDQVERPSRRLIPHVIIAPAAALVILAAVALLLWPKPERPAVRQAKNPPEVRRETATESKPRLTPKPKAIVVALEREPVRRHFARHRHIRRLTPKSNIPAVAPQDNVAGLPKKTTEPAPTPPAEPTSALACVTWHVASKPSGIYQASYTLKDAETGEITKCSVKRHGNSIEVDMEAEPASPEPQPAPAKENSRNETPRYI